MAQGETGIAVEPPVARQSVAVEHEERARREYEREGTPLLVTPGGWRVDVRSARWRP